MIFESFYINSPVWSNIYMWNKIIKEETPLSTGDCTVEPRSCASLSTSQHQIVHFDNENGYREYQGSYYMIHNSRIGSFRIRIFRFVSGSGKDDHDADSFVTKQAETGKSYKVSQITNWVRLKIEFLDFDILIVCDV